MTTSVIVMVNGQYEAKVRQEKTDENGQPVVKELGVVGPNRWGVFSPYHGFKITIEEGPYLIPEAAS